MTLITWNNAARKNPPTLTSQGSGRWKYALIGDPAFEGRDKTAATRERLSDTDPIVVARENPLTLTLSPQGRGEGTIGLAS